MRHIISFATLISISSVFVGAFNGPVRTVDQQYGSSRGSHLQLHATPPQQESRRNALSKFGQIFGVIASVDALQTESSISYAADKEPTIWKSGKAPIVPGQKPKDKNDTTGTRKDGNFLRAISNCKVSRTTYLYSHFL